MYGRRRGAGAIEDFDIARFGGPTRSSERQFTATTSPQQGVPANPDRVMLIITNNGPDNVTWGLDGTVVAGTRQLLGAGQTEVFQVQNDGELTGRAIWFVAPINPTAMAYLEVERVRSEF